MNLAYNRLIDHTLLKPDATFEAVELLCKEAKEYHFASVCINPHFVKVAALSLKGTDVKVCTVIGFPLGQNTTETKVFETSKAILDGAQEIDMVINISQLKARHDDLVVDDIHRVKMACQGHLLKVIIETCLLNDDEKVRACKLSVSAGADFVKTSTGFSTSGATPTDVALMRKTVGPMIGVKASGGVRSFEDLLTMVKAGATRIGTSSGVKIMTSQTDSTSKY